MLNPFNSIHCQRPLDAEASPGEQYFDEPVKKPKELEQPKNKTGKKPGDEK